MNVSAIEEDNVLAEVDDRAIDGEDDGDEGDFDEGDEDEDEAFRSLVVRVDRRDLN